MKSVLCVLLLAAACGGKKPAPATPSNDQPAATGSGSATDCPATLNCQPPTNDKDALCKLSQADLKQRCPNTQVVE